MGILHNALYVFDSYQQPTCCARAAKISKSYLKVMPALCSSGSNKRISQYISTTERGVCWLYPKYPQPR
jgi:hypothetical protein